MPGASASASELPTGEVRGVVVGERSEAAPTWETLRVDIGAATRDEALSVVRPGDPIVLDGAPEALRNGRILSAALDDRAGIFACLEALRRLAADPPAWDVAVVVSTQEESGVVRRGDGGRGQASPRGRDRRRGHVRRRCAGAALLGRRPARRRPVVFRGPVLSPIVSDGLLAVAGDRGLPFALETGPETWSDADGLAAVAGGIACGMVSIPLRYMHSAGEIAQLSDVDAASRLIEAYVRSLAAETSFLR